MKKWLLGLLCMALGLLAAPSAKAASVAPNGLGDVLIFPAYYAEGMARSKIMIVNTSDTNSVVAKVVIRRGSDSQETLDFFVYLSPDDYFEGEIYCVGGSCYFTSDDESWLVGNCQTPALSYPLQGGEPVGYVEVIEAWSANLGAHPSQQVICQAYNAWGGGEDTTINSLGGWMTIYWPGEKLAYRAKAVADYNNTAKLTIGTETILNPSIIGPLFSKGTFVVPYDQSDGVDLLVVNFITRKATHVYTWYKFNWFDTDEDTCLPPGCEVSPCKEEEEECYSTQEVTFIGLTPDCEGEGFDPTKGWVRVKLTDVECVPKTDAAIGLLVRAKLGQFAIADPAWLGEYEEPTECSDPGEEVCADYTDKDACILAGCGWVMSSPSACHSCGEASSESACLMLNGCEWNDGECVPVCKDNWVY